MQERIKRSKAANPELNYHKDYDLLLIPEWVLVEVGDALKTEQKDIFSEMFDEIFEYNAGIRNLSRKI